MAIYDDLLANKGRGSPVDKLNPVSDAKLEKVSAKFNAAPADYLHFLRRIGAGELGNGMYMLYDGLLEPEEVFGDGSGLDGIFFFGDDFQGFNAGFDSGNGSVVEVDPTNRKPRLVASTFQSFIRQKIEEA